jgi:hypothetical protein
LRGDAIGRNNGGAMIPVDMTTKHEPPNSIGDCFPCCIASILELPRDAVPHVYEGEGWLDETGAVGMNRLQEWLASQGLYYLEFGIKAEHLPDWTKFLNCHYVFSGMSPRGFRHATVGHKGAMAHDPHPSRDGVVPDAGEYSLGFVVTK